MNTFRIGAVIPFNGGLSRVAERAQDFARYRFAHYWLAQAFSVDALTALTAIGQHLPGVELGTSVVPIYGRHPMTLAMQALTAQAALGGRLTLGVGLSHRWVIEEMLGLSFARPARHMREYLQALVPMLNGEQVDYTGETVATHLLRGPLDVPDAAPVPVLVAALGPRMLEIAGRMTQGTLTWMTGPRTIAAHIVPAISAAARAAGRRPPRIAAGIQFCVTGDVAAARAYAGPQLEHYRALPSYQAMLAREGLTEPVDVAVIGDAARLRAALRDLQGAGVTDVVANVVGPPECLAPTLEVLAAGL